MNLWLGPIPLFLRDDARAAFDAGDFMDFLSKANKEHRLALVACNLAALQTKGLYEPALLHAFCMTRTISRGFSLETLRRLFNLADRGRGRRGRARRVGVRQDARRRRVCGDAPGDGDTPSSYPAAVVNEDRRFGVKTS
jgi:hypothetical protein